MYFLKSDDDAEATLKKVSDFLAKRGLKVSEKKTKITATTDGFDFLGWHVKVQTNGKFRCVPSEDNFRKLRKKVKSIVNNSNYGAKAKARKLAPLVRGWRNYHRYCDMSKAKFSLWHLNHRAFKVFNKEPKLNCHSSIELVKKAFPAVSYAENRYISVKGNKSPFDGDLAYWSERNSKLYDDITSVVLKRQKHTCSECGLKFYGDERIHLHHIDRNHDNWKRNNLKVVHESCHDYIHMC